LELGTEWPERQNVNHSIFNVTYVVQLGPSLNNAMIDVNYVNICINGDNYQLMDYNNKFNENRLGRWYHGYKKFKNNYSNNFNTDDMISYQSFRNLYRLFVFDISKQSEVVRLEFNFNSVTS